MAAHYLNDLLYQVYQIFKTLVLFRHRKNGFELYADSYEWLDFNL